MARVATALDWLLIGWVMFFSIKKFILPLCVMVLFAGCGCSTAKKSVAIPDASAPTDQTSAPAAVKDEASAFEEQSDGDSDVETPVVIEEPAPALPMNDGQPWTAPNYTGQDSALGYTPQDFAITPGMKERVQFWIDIYSKYTSSQGVLHDSQYINFVYTNVDFSSISKDSSLTDRQKYRARQKLVKEKKQEIVERLKRLQ
jgi:hypothetical protein